MTTRWEVERALMRSNIKPLARLLVFTLLAKVDNETAVVPPEFTPSLSTLVAATGLARSVIAEHLKYLEGLGWVKRSTPARRSKYDRTHYALFVGHDDPTRPSSSRPGLLDGSTNGLGSSPQHGLVRETDSSSPAQIPPVVRDANYSDDASSPPDGLPAVQDPDYCAGGSSPGDGHASTNNISTKSTTSSTSGKRAKRKTDDPPPRTDVERVCRYLADKIVENGSKRPQIGKGWRDAARLLIDRDGRTVDQIMTCIDWCQADEFWRRNILSMPTLREQYDRLRLAAQHKNRQMQSTHGAQRNTGANRHVDDLTPEQRSARNPFAGAVRASQVAAGGTP